NFPANKLRRACRGEVLAPLRPSLPSLRATVSAQPLPFRAKVCHCRGQNSGSQCSGAPAMEYDELVAKVVELLQREKRVPYRSLKGRFALDDDYIEDLKIDLIEAKRLAIDENDRILVWIGDAQAVTSHGARRTTSTGHGPCRTTCSATLPKNTWASPVRPCVPMIIKSTPCSPAVSTIVRVGVPWTRRLSPWSPARWTRSRLACRRRCASVSCVSR